MSSSEERDDLDALRQLAQPAEPPAELEDRLVAALRDRDLIAAPSPRRPGHQAAPQWAIAAALLAAALGGWTARGVRQASPPPSPDGKEFLLLLAEPRGLQTSKSELELVAEYGAWAMDLATEGKLVTGKRLEADGQRLTRPTAGAIVESPHDFLSEATGFFLVRADGWEEALEIAADCPHLGYGGEISLREIARDG